MGMLWILLPFSTTVNDEPVRKQAAVATKEPTRRTTRTSGEGKSARAQNRHAQSLCTLGEFQAPSYGMRERERERMQVRRTFYLFIVLGSN